MSQLEPSPDVEPGKTVSRNRKIIEVTIGFFGWYLVSGLIWSIARGSESSPFIDNTGLFLTLLSLPLNIIVLLVCASVPRLRRVALGILIAIALNFVISLLLGPAFNAYCFIPFFHK